MSEATAPKIMLSTSSQKVTTHQVASYTCKTFRVTGTGYRARQALLGCPGHLLHAATYYLRCFQRTTTNTSKCLQFTSGLQRPGLAPQSLHQACSQTGFPPPDRVGLPF